MYRVHTSLAKPPSVCAKGRPSVLTTTNNDSNARRVQSLSRATITDYNNNNNNVYDHAVRLLCGRRGSLSSARCTSGRRRCTGPTRAGASGEVGCSRSVTHVVSFRRAHGPRSNRRVQSRAAQSPGRVVPRNRVAAPSRSNKSFVKKTTDFSFFSNKFS